MLLVEFLVDFIPYLLFELLRVAIEKSDRRRRLNRSAEQLRSPASRL